MHRKSLVSLLHAYQPRDCHEEKCRQRCIELVECYPQCFERSLEPGHITGSGWLLNGNGTKALLTRHKKLRKWLQPGGHADGDPDALNVALREAREESGITNIVPVSRDIFDIDVHFIPACGETAAHYHYDIRFLLQVRGSCELVVSDESLELAWVAADELQRYTQEESLLRMGRKWQQWAQSDYRAIS